MLGLTIALPIPLALFILTLALAWRGFQKSNSYNVRRFWILLGFGEIILAFICFIALPNILWLTATGTYVASILFSIISLGVALTACLFLTKE